VLAEISDVAKMFCDGSDHNRVVQTGKAVTANRRYSAIKPKHQ
jgi:hypothetical protein